MDLSINLWSLLVGVLILMRPYYLLFGVHSTGSFGNCHTSHDQNKKPSYTRGLNRILRPKNKSSNFPIKAEGGSQTSSKFCHWLDFFRARIAARSHHTDRKYKRSEACKPEFTQHLGRHSMLHTTPTFSLNMQDFNYKLATELQIKGLLNS